MRLLVYDLQESPFPAAQDRLEVAAAQCKAAPCQGCFRCWTQNPGYCVLKDQFQHNGKAEGISQQITVVSQICYGGYSPAVKRFFDRGISDSLPFLTLRQGKTYHMNRYRNRFQLIVYFYGSCDEFERQTAQQYVERQAVNLNAASFQVFFLDKPEQLKQVEL